MGQILTCAESHLRGGTNARYMLALAWFASHSSPGKNRRRGTRLCLAASLRDANVIFGCSPRVALRLPGAILLLSLRDGHLRCGRRSREAQPLPCLKGETWGTRHPGRGVTSSHVSKARHGAPGIQEEESPPPMSQRRDMGHPARKSRNDGHPFLLEG